MNRRRFRLAFLIALALLGAAARAADDNGFDLSGSLVPADEIHPGGPVRDGIPSIDHPRFVPASDAGFVANTDQILGIQRNGIVRAYPIGIMNWHEIVNDRFGAEPIAITYCPLCGTGVAFVAGSGSRSKTFGVSGLLYNSDVLLFDRETESLWSQIKKQAVAGPLKGQRLQALPLTHTTWRAWRREHPNTEVLSAETGYRRNYAESPYDGYETDQGLYFPVSGKSRRYHPKERVLGVEVGGVFKAYPFAELSRIGGEIEDRVGGQRLLIRFDWANESARAFDLQGNQLPAMTAFWFAWFAFHPDTEVFTPTR